MQLLRVPYHLTGGTAFLERGEVKDALSWLRLVANPDDDAAFLRAVQSPKREVGATTLAKLAELAQHAGMPMSRAAESMGALKQLRRARPTRWTRFVDIVRDLRDEARAAVRRPNWCGALAERSGLLAALRAQCKDEASLRSAARPTWTNWPTGSTARASARPAANWPRSWRCCRTPTRAMPATRCG